MIANPYVGPRPLAEGDPFFGRDREVSELRYLLGSERIVLFYAPSGAGKSSLVNAKLVPELRRRFDCWPATRVTAGPDGVTARNKYVWSAVSGFEKEVPLHFGRRGEELSQQTLKQYFDARPRRPDAPPNVLLVFDQFEEIVRVDAVNLPPKHEFFEQLGELLMDPTVWALFILREDFLAPLDPYAAQLPTRFKNRFRMDLLSAKQAEEAIANPAALAGRSFKPEAVTRLITDLATVQVQRPDGAFGSDIGAYVEPMHLQIVCRTLWERLPPSQTVLEASDVEQLGEVTKVLAAYYAAEVARVAAGDRGVERTIRLWIEKRLIISGSVRNQVMRTSDTSEGLSNVMIDKLVDSHLLREEQRVNARWYELAHDRLIRPVTTDNESWFAANLTEAQRRAELWAQQNEPKGLLLTGASLEHALTWRKAQAQVTKEEQRFLDESVAAEQIAARERAQAKRIRKLAVVSAIGGVVALLLLTAAAGLFVYAREQERRALSLELAARSQYQSADKPLSVLLALYALREQCTREGREALLTAVQNEIGASFRGAGGSIYRLAIAKASGRMVSAGRAGDHQLRIWDLNSSQQLGSIPTPRAGVDFSGACFLRPELVAGSLNDGSVLFFRPGGTTVSAAPPTGAAASDIACDGPHRTLALASSASQPPVGVSQIAPIRVRELHIPSAIRVVFNPSGSLLAATRTNGSVTVYDAQNLQVIQELGSFSNTAEAVRFSDNGEYLAAGSFDDTVALWRTSDWRQIHRSKALGLGGVFALTFSPNGQRLALGGGNGSSRLLRVPEMGEALTLPKAGAAIESLSYVGPGDGRLLAGSADGNIYLYDLNLQRLARTALALPNATNQLNNRQCNTFLDMPSCPPIELPLKCEDP